MSPVAVVKGLRLSLRLAETRCLYSYHGRTSTHTHTHTLTHKYTHLLSFSLLTSLHYREDGEDHLQFSNLYDSALFNQRPLFLL